MRNYTQEYKYDELGNMTEMKSNGVWSRDYRYNFAENNYLLGHDLESTADTYLYDAHGNMTKMPHLQELKWDYADNLKEVTLDASGNTAYYVYDASGNRVRKTVVKGNITENRFYAGDYEIFTKTTNGTLDTERETLHISDDKQKTALIDYDTQNDATTIRYQLTNHLDSASIELDENADIISYEEYHPFGTTSYRSGRNAAEVSLKRYKYVFKELDNETGLYYYGMRYYAAWTARFVSVDPLQFDYPDLTPFQYASNRPISGIDLDGLEYIDVSIVKKNNFPSFLYPPKTQYNNKEYFKTKSHLYKNSKGEISSNKEKESKQITENLFGPDFCDTDYFISVKADKSQFVGWNYQKFDKNIGAVVPMTQSLTILQYRNPDFYNSLSERERNSYSWQCGQLCNEQIKILTNYKKSVTSSTENKQIQLFYSSDNRLGLTEGAVGDPLDAFIYIKENIDNGIPVALLVDYAKREHAPNKDGSEHYVTAMGYGVENGVAYVYFWDNATTDDTKGTQLSNKLFFNSELGTFQGKAPNIRDTIPKSV